MDYNVKAPSERNINSSGRKPGDMGKVQNEPQRGGIVKRIQ